jgi:hypothetical protein
MEAKRTIVSIVGTSGRRGDAMRMSSALFSKMCARAEQIITDELKLQWSSVHLQSGGSAWSDHVAVRLYLKHDASTLMLFLPCQLRMRTDRRIEFLDNKSSDWHLNPGWLCNRVHHEFGRVLGVDTCGEIYQAYQRSAVLDVDSSGFHERNTRVAQCDVLIAFSWGASGDAPTSGGTLDTWKKCTGRRILVKLETL